METFLPRLAVTGRMITLKSPRTAANTGNGIRPGGTVTATDTRCGAGDFGHPDPADRSGPQPDQSGLPTRRGAPRRWLNSDGDSKVHRPSTVTAAPRPAAGREPAAPGRDPWCPCGSRRHCRGDRGRRRPASPAAPRNSGRRSTDRGPPADGCGTAPADHRLDEPVGDARGGAGPARVRHPDHPARGRRRPGSARSRRPAPRGPDPGRVVTSPSVARHAARRGRRPRPRSPSAPGPSRRCGRARGRWPARPGSPPRRPGRRRRAHPG